ncbi:MAG TPA: hypothetical protein VI485_25845 [Vicinamibacterales bacterium]|nr:hypothetical protein [Vicinamibacterales bacterium]
MRDITSTFDEGLIHRVRGEFLEMPGLRLTRKQAQRLWGFDEETCTNVLESLVETRFLRRIGLDTYLRYGEGAVASFRQLPVAAADVA